MRMRFFFLLASMGLGLPPLALACSGSVDTEPAPTAGTGGQAGHSSTTTFGHGGDAGDSKDALPDYTDPGCPDAGPPPTNFMCDPYNQNNGDCGSDEGCYIFVDYPPPDDPCGQETYGAQCLKSGFGQQGSPCAGPTQCEGGFACVVSGSGDQCVQLCPLQGNDGCPPGLVCEPIDVEGFGGCL